MPTVGVAWRGSWNFRFGQGDANLGSIGPGDIVAFLQQTTERKTPYRDKNRATYLRSFLQYLFRKGLTLSNLALGIPKVAHRPTARLPRHITPEQVEAVLAAVRSDPQFGRRNYAMVLLLARLGLRAQVVVAIQLDDIDWRAGELVVRGKGQRHDRVPIPPDAGEAVANYIRHDPCPLRAPYSSRRARRTAHSRMERNSMSS